MDGALAVVETSMVIEAVDMMAMLDVEAAKEASEVNKDDETTCGDLGSSKRHYSLKKRR